MPVCDYVLLIANMSLLDSDDTMKILTEYWYLIQCNKPDEVSNYVKR